MNVFFQENPQAVVDDLAKNLPILTKSINGGNSIRLLLYNTFCEELHLLENVFI